LVATALLAYAPCTIYSHSRGAKEGSDMSNEVHALQAALRQFAEERDWGQFHTPKNLAASLSIVTGELMEHFQCITDPQSQSRTPEQRDNVALEIADVLLYLLQLSAKLQFDPVEAARRKLALNAAKYPVERARGSSKKYKGL